MLCDFNIWTRMFVWYTGMRPEPRSSSSAHRQTRIMEINKNTLKSLREKWICLPQGDKRLIENQYGDIPCESIKTLSLLWAITAELYCQLWLMLTCDTLYWLGGRLTSQMNTKICVSLLRLGPTIFYKVYIMVHSVIQI